MIDHYDYNDLGYGVELISPCGETVFLQGDDACEFIDDTIRIDELWAESGNPNPSIFTSQEDHIDLIIDPYFN
jgi:hypothetical protein